MGKSVLILGAKSFGKTALNILQENGLMVYGFLEDDLKLAKKEVHGVPVLGDCSAGKFLDLLKAEECIGFVAVEDPTSHEQLVQKLQEEYKVHPVNVIHKQVTLGNCVELGTGNLIEAGTNIGAGAIVSSHNRIGANIVIDCDVEIHDFVHIGAGSIIGKGVKIEQFAYIEQGVIIADHVRIGEGAKIPCGAVIYKDVAPFARIPVPIDSYVSY